MLPTIVTLVRNCLLFVFFLILPFTLAVKAQAQLSGSLYVALDAPCLVVDTRNTGTTSIPALGTIEAFAYGDDLTAQGGIGSPGCPNPKPSVNPVAALLTITAVGDAAGAPGFGNLQVYPADGVASGPTVLFKNANNSNTTVVRLCNDGFCDGKFGIEAKKSAVPVVVTVEGYFYSKPSREATVAVAGGDYSSISEALADSDSWCPSPEILNPCRVTVGPGGFFTSGVQMKSYISVVGAGRFATTAGFSTEGPIFIFDGAQWSSLSNMNVVNTGALSPSDPVGISINTTGGNSNGVVLKDLEIQVISGSNSNQGIVIEDSGNIGSVGLIRIESVGIINANSDPNSVGLVINSQANVLIDNLKSFFPNTGGTALAIASGITLTEPISNSRFTGNSNDIFANGVTATLLNTYLGTGAIDFTGSNILCLNVAKPTTVLTPGCSE